MKKKFEIGLEGITSSEFVQVSGHRELAGSGHMLSTQKQRTGFWSLNFQLVLLSGKYVSNNRH